MKETKRNILYKPDKASFDCDKLTEPITHDEPGQCVGAKETPKVVIGSQNELNDEELTKAAIKLFEWLDSHELIKMATVLRKANIADAQFSMARKSKSKLKQSVIESIIEQLKPYGYV